MSLTYVNSPKDWLQPPYVAGPERIPSDRPKHDPSANVQVPVVLPTPIVPDYDGGGHGKRNHRRGLSAGQAAVDSNIPVYEEEMDIIIDSIFDPWANQATSHPNQVPVLSGMHELIKEEKPTLFSPWEQKELKTETLPVTSTGVIPALIQQPIGEMTEIEFKNLVKSEGESMLAPNEFTQQDAIITDQEVFEPEPKPFLPGSFPKEKMSTPSAVERKAAKKQTKPPKSKKGVVKPGVEPGALKAINDRAIKEAKKPKPVSKADIKAKKTKTVVPSVVAPPKRKATEELAHKLKSKKLNPAAAPLVKKKKRKASTQLVPTAPEKKTTAKVKKAPPPKLDLKKLPASKQGSTKAAKVRAEKDSTVSKTTALNLPKKSARKKASSSK